MYELPGDLAAQVALALREDIQDGDVTAELIDPHTSAGASIVCREDAVLCGRAWVDETFAALDPACRVSWHYKDGDELSADTRVCELTGPARALVSGERTALNFLQTLSGTATATRRCVDKLRGTQTQLLDTRKTIPGLRLAQKYAVRCGGAENHRIGLFDAILIKENHIDAAGSIEQAISAMHLAHPKLRLEIEVESVADAERAIAAGADMLLLDNFSNVELKRAVEMTRSRVKLEASGGFELDALHDVALTGVDYISVGALTKHLKATDFSMRFRP